MDEQELREAFADYGRRVEEFRTSGEWAGFADLFTPDADYVEHAFGTFKGRDQIRRWILDTMGAYPGNVMTGFPVGWSVVDVENSRIVCEIRNLMPDLGDGIVREAGNITILTYAGDGLWSREEDVYNPAHFLELGLQWARAAEQHGALNDEAAAFLAAYGGPR